MTTDKMGAILATGPWQHELRAAAAPALAGIAVMAASLINFLNHNQYPLLRPEVGLVAALLLAGVLLMAVVYACGGRIVRMVLQVLLIYIALDLNFDGLLVPLAAVGAAVVLQRHAIPFIAVAASVVLVSMFAGMAFADRSPNNGAPAPAAAKESNLPVIVHLVLDEHIGVEALLHDIPEAAAMGETLKRFYLDKGFRLFGAAYSEHMRTMNALPRLFNFGAGQPWDPARRIRSSLSSNAYFDRLGEAGYRIFVSQTDYIDYCNNRFVVECSTRRAAELTAVVDAPLSTADKAEIITVEFAKLSPVLLLSAAIYVNAADAEQVQTIPPTGPLRTIRRLAGELRNAAPGSVYFVHELLPHTPYALDRDCRLKERGAWRSQSHGPRKERMRAYLDQIACLNRMTEDIFEAAGPGAIIVVHSDHGSRITDIEPNIESIGTFSDHDLLAGYATLFAVRAPSIEAGYDSRTLPITELLRTLALSRFRSADISLATDFQPTVVLEGQDWKPERRHPLPAGRSGTHDKAH